MSALSMLAAGGVWPAVPLTGYLLFWRPQAVALHGVPPLTALTLMTVAGLTVWSPLLLGAAVAGLYHAEVFGLIGWTVAAAALLLRSRAVPKQSAGVVFDQATRGSATADRVLAAGLMVAAILYLAFPTQSIYGGRDEGVYANHGIYIAQHGRSDVPYPWPNDLHPIFLEGSVKFPGFYKTQSTMTVQFGHLFSAWLAQAFATLRQHGLFRLNAVFSLLSLGAFYGLCRRLLPAGYAVAATLFLALSPSQLWVARITLSEILTQLLIWSGLLLLLSALRDGRPSLGRWAGAFFGTAAFVRFDSLLLAPVLLLGHTAFRLASLETSTGTHVAHEPDRNRRPGLGVRSPADLNHASLKAARDPTRAARKNKPTASGGVEPSQGPAVQGHADASGVWIAAYQTAFPIWALSVWYFATFSAPYLAERGYVSKLLIAFGASVLLLLASQTPVVRVLRPLLTARATVALGAIFWTGFALWAYYIRSAASPAPQLRLRWPGYYLDITRDYSRDSLVNLGRYLSVPVVWAALVGWYRSFYEGVAAKRDAALLPALVLVLGFSIAHLAYPIPEDHIWVVRRFVLVVIPGFVLCAALGVHWLLSKLPATWLPAAAGLVLIFLAGFAARADSLFLTFAEDKGYFDQLQRLAQKLPADEVILARGQTEWITPLYVGFDRRVIPLNLDARARGRVILDAWVTRQSNQGKPVYLAMEGAADLRGYRVERLDEVVLTRSFSEPTLTPLPTKTLTQERRIGVYKISGAS